MTSPPVTVLDAFPSAPDPGKQLVDPSAFYMSLQMLLGFQEITAVPNAQAPGPLLSMAVNTAVVPAGSGAGPFNVRMPVALGGLRIIIINLASGNLNLNASYNPAVGRNDQITGVTPMPSGNVYSCIVYRPGFWYITPVATGLPGSDESLIPPDEPPPEEC